jgi:hypothetical protein
MARACCRTYVEGDVLQHQVEGLWWGDGAGVSHVLAVIASVIIQQHTAT